VCVFFVCGLLQGTATATPPYTSLQRNKWTTQRPGGISLNEQGLLSPEIKCNSACHPNEDRRIFLHYFNMQYSEYLGNNKDSYA